MRAYNIDMNETTALTADILDDVKVGETYVWTYRKSSHTVTIKKLTKHMIFCTDASGFELEINR